MSNVINLFQYDKIEDNISAPQTAITVAVEGILAKSGQLSAEVTRLSGCFDAIDRIIDELQDEQLRDRQKLLMELHRQALIGATLELSREVRRLPLI